MTEAHDAPCFDLAIVGGGAGGVLTAIHALRQAARPVRIALIEPGPTLAQGVAYATTYPEHLLNVPAGRMSGFASAAGDFLDFVVANDASGSDREHLAHQFVERRRYGAYLRERLDQAIAASRATLEVIPTQVIRLDENADGIVLSLQDGRQVRACGVVLAVGNTPKPLPAQGAQDLPPHACLAAWDFDAVKRIPVDAEVCIAGSGLSMVDAALSLAANGHRGAIHVVSRHALLPLPHAAHAVAAFDPAPLIDMPLRQRVRAVREHVREAIAAGLPWQAAMETLRPHGQKLWGSLSQVEQRRFLRHVVRYWDVHRHRIAATVHAQLQTMIERGQMRLHRGRLQRVARRDERVQVDIHAHDGAEQTLTADVVINATGVEMRATSMRNPLLADLLVKGLATPGPHGIGILTTTDGQMIDAQGRTHSRLLALGSLRIGTLWESIAVPELRGQAETAARHLLERTAQ